MSDAIFVDTNVLVYRRDTSERAKQRRAQAWVERLWVHRRGRLSSQVLQEYYQTVTRKLSPGLPRAEAREEVRELATWRPIDTSPDLLERAFVIEDRFGLSLWESLIVAAAQRLACAYLLTEDLQDGQDLDGVVVVDPFTHAPETVGLGE